MATLGPMTSTSRSALRLSLAATAVGALCATTLFAAAATAAPAANPSGKSISVTLAGTHATGIFDASAAEIPAFDATTDTLFVVNAESGAVDVLDLGADGVPVHRDTLSVAGSRAADGSTVDEGAVVNSVAVSGGILAVAVEAEDKVQHGWVLFYATNDLAYLGGVRVGSLPDSLAFTPNGAYVVVANEGEPADDFSSDPEGTISVISVPKNRNQFGRLDQSSVRTVDFRAYDEGTPLPDGVRVFGPDVAVPEGHETVGYTARNLEPEYVTIDATGRTAYISVQEANAIAVVDIKSASLTDLWALELTDWSVDGKLDASDRDSGINLRNWPVHGVPMPDGIATYRFRGQDLVVTANEGDAREWGDFADVRRAGHKSITLCEDAFPNAAELKDNANLGRLNIITDLGYNAEGACYNELYAFGSRSFSIYTADGERLFDSAGQFEAKIAELIDAGELPAEAFNSNHSEGPSFDKRSDDKGVEPEAVAIGAIQGRTYAFIGLERIGGVMIYDITDPRAAFYVDYVNNRDFSVAYDEDGGDWAAAGDLGAEGLVFVPANQSPTGEALLVVANEVSGTTSVFEVTPTR